MFALKLKQKRFLLMNHTAYLPLVCALLLCNACGNKYHKTQAAVMQTHTDTISTFVFPTIPNILTEPEARASYLVEHYWDHTNFADTNYIHHPDIMEQAWVNYIDLMKLVPYPAAVSSLKNTFNDKGKHKKCYLYLMELAEKYLYDPNSPMRDEELYIPTLEAVLTSQVLNESEKIRPKSRLELALKNRLGTPATDFSYTLASGKQGTLYALETPYILLYINNPGCHACEETLHELRSNSLIAQMVANRQLTVLSLYPDEDLNEWKKYLNTFPAEWINAYDAHQVLTRQRLYDLKAIPTLYLLGQDKTVLLKDASVPQIASYLKRK